MAKQILFDDPARAALLRGIDTVADLVGCTLGPRGGTVVIGRPLGFGPAKITKDGVTVAAENSLPDPLENEGAKLAIEVAQRTNQEAGDGTTAATILVRALFREGLRQLNSGSNPHALKRGIQRGVDTCVEELKRMAIPVVQENRPALVAVATIAANGDAEIGALIGEAVSLAGLEGTYSPDSSPDGNSSYKITEGLQFQRGFLDPTFMRDRARGQTVFEPCNIFVTDRNLVDGKQMVAFLENYRSFAAAVPLLMIAGDVAGTALSTLALNNARGVLQVCVVRTPGTGESRKEEIEDIAILTGARYFRTSEQALPETATVDDFGSARCVTVTPHHTTIVGGEGTALRVEGRKDELRGRLKDPSILDFDKAVLERRLAAISASIVVFKIGSKVNSGFVEKRDRFEDSVRATLAALKEGVVPGGGTALLRCLPGLLAVIETLSGDDKNGAQIVAQALTAPLHQLASNAGKSGDVIVDKVLQFVSKKAVGISCLGWNADAGRYEDLVNAGILDPAMVVRLALQNSAELAGLLLTAKAMIVDLPEGGQR